MDRDNVISIEAHKLADLIIAEWISAYSDNGSIWSSADNELQKAKEVAGQAIVDEAVELARARWERMHGR
jgi:hypothetical protein